MTIFCALRLPDRYGSPPETLRSDLVNPKRWAVAKAVQTYDSTG
jgi:hypothetical protein